MKSLLFIVCLSPSLSLAMEKPKYGPGLIEQSIRYLLKTMGINDADRAGIGSQTERDTTKRIIESYFKTLDKGVVTQESSKQLKERIPLFFIAAEGLILKMKSFNEEAGETAKQKSTAELDEIEAVTQQAIFLERNLEALNRYLIMLRETKEKTSHQIAQQRASVKRSSMDSAGSASAAAEGDNPFGQPPQQ